QPEDDVRLAAHRTNFDNLFQTKLSGRNARVNQVSKFRIAFSVTLDHRSRVDAGGGAKCVATEDRIIEGNGPVAGFSGLVAVFAQAHQVVLNPAQQLQIYQQLIHRGVADALSHPERRAMDLIGPAFDCPD